MTGLPAWLSAALQGKLDHVSRADLRDRARTISDAYRAGGSSGIVRSDMDALAYAVARMPATYAAVRAALTHAAELIPDFEPRSVLDAGAGPGTSSWAGIDTWPAVRQITLVDSNPRLLDLARDFHAANAGVAIDIIDGDLTRALDDMPGSDLVMASYALAELAPAALPGALDALWRRSGRLLVIVEPGTMDGFRRILTCREHLIGSGAQIVAPCSHDGRCPLAEDARWCHFAARLPRSRDHLIAKSGSVPFEDEKYSYLVAARDLGDIVRGRRVLATPKVGKAAVELTLCAPDRPDNLAIQRRDKDDYRIAKRLRWGDRLSDGFPAVPGKAPHASPVN